MKLRKLQLENFRNYNRHEYEFPEDKKITILVGPNGKGKTNFLEAIYVLSLGKSFRTILQDDLIEWEFDYMRCKCETEIDGEETSLEVFYSNYPRKQKGFKKNDVSMKNSEYIGNLITVLFHPEDLNMLYLSPSYRRKYLNILLSQTDKKYLEALTKYKKTLKQRNALLHAIREAKFTNNTRQRSGRAYENNLDVWDTEIMGFGSIIIKKRVELTQFLNKNLEKIYQSISGGKEKVEIKYQTIKGEYEAELIVRRDRDIRGAKTTLGPHRDDLKFFIDGKEILSSASRGEFRTLLLAIKLAEIQFIKEKTGRNPILLLDDVFSELDRKRGEHLLNSIKDCQTIITTTDQESFEKLDKEGKSLRFVKIE